MWKRHLIEIIWPPASDNGMQKVHDNVEEGPKKDFLGFPGRRWYEVVADTRTPSRPK